MVEKKSTKSTLLQKINKSKNYEINAVIIIIINEYLYTG